MMHRKGVLFAPDSAPTVALAPAPVPTAAPLTPAAMRTLGRQIPNFSDEVWRRERYGIVVQGNLYKFRQDAGLARQLLATGDAELVEASPRDRTWGVGFGAKNAEKNRAKWGLNLLGKALMEVRTRLREEEEEKAAGMVVSESSG